MSSIGDISCGATYTSIMLTPLCRLNGEYELIQKLKPNRDSHKRNLALLGTSNTSAKKGRNNSDPVLANATT